MRLLPAFDVSTSPAPYSPSHPYLPVPLPQLTPQDKAAKDKIDGRNALESYAYNVKTQLEDEEKGIAGKVDADEKEILQKAVQETLDWLDENASAEAEDFKEQQKKVCAGDGGVLGGSLSRLTWCSSSAWQQQTLSTS